MKLKLIAAAICATLSACGGGSAGAPATPASIASTNSGTTVTSPTVVPPPPPKSSDLGVVGFYADFTSPLAAKVGAKTTVNLVFTTAIGASTGGTASNFKLSGLSRLPADWAVVGVVGDTFSCAVVNASATLCTLSLVYSPAAATSVQDSIALHWSATAQSGGPSDGVASFGYTAK